VPARADGVWRTPQGELALTQRYQRVSGTLGAGPLAVPVQGRLTGDRIALTAGGAEYRGRVAGDTIDGTVATQGAIRPWKAGR
jgi:hypothetical protein